MNNVCIAMCRYGEQIMNIVMSCMIFESEIRSVIITNNIDRALSSIALQQVHPPIDDLHTMLPNYIVWYTIIQVSEDFVELEVSCIV